MTDNGTGELTVVKTEDSDVVEFTNRYSASGKVQLTAKKELTGKVLEEGAYSFELKDATGRVLQTKSNAADGTITFDEISYTLDDVASSPVTYTISEVIPADAVNADGETYSEAEDKSGTFTKDGITYDSTPQEIKVTLTDNKNGTITATPDKNGASVKFTNAYDATGSITLGGTKKIDKRNFKEGDTATFQIEAVTEGAPLPTPATVTIDPTSGSSQDFGFGAIGYQLSDLGGASEKTFEYKVTETVADMAGTTKDSSVKTVKVKVTDNGTGELTVVKTEDSDTVEFTNAYDATGHIDLAGTKVIENRSFAEGDTWTFTVTTSEEGAPLPANNPVTVSPTSGTTADIVYGRLNYTLSDLGGATEKVFNYTITETGSGSGVTNDSRTHTMAVTVRDNGDGTLSVTKEEANGGLSFINTYGADGEITLTGTKTLENRAFKAGDKWTFTVTSSDDDAPMPEHESVTIEPESGNVASIDFGKIRYTLAHKGKTYTYVITESLTVDGVTNDEKATRTVKISVTDDGSGRLVVAKTADSEEISFTNTYDATGSITLGGTKKIDKRNFKEGDTATFQIEAVTEGAPLPTPATVTIDPTSGSSQDFGFGAIGYQLSDLGGASEKTFEYKVTETVADMAGTTKDSSVKTVKVKVTDNGTGELTVVKTEDSDVVEFTNRYSASGKVQLTAKKELTGKVLEEGAYSFELKDATGRVLQTKSNAADGTITFDEISYTLDDVASSPVTYTISEVIPADAVNADGETYSEAEDKSGTFTKDGITYDSTPQEIKVTLTDNKNGTITATPDKNGASVKFTNAYDATGYIGLSGTKKFDNGSFSDNTFTFTVYKKSDFESATSGILGIGAKKRNELADDTELAEKKVATASTAGAEADESGVVSFNFTEVENRLHYTLADLTKKKDGVAYDEFEYVVVEDIPAGAVEKTVGDETFYYDSENDIKYDAKVYNVTVTVTDKGDGTLDVKASDDETTFGFTNGKIYTQLSLTKTIDKFIGEDTDGEYVNATLVFNIHYIDPITGESTDRSVSVIFDKDNVTPKTVTVEKIPIDAEVTVKEVYSSNYKPGTVTVTKMDENGYPVWKASCDNTQINTNTGSGVINTIDKNAEGKYEITDRTFNASGGQNEDTGQQDQQDNDEG